MQKAINERLMSVDELGYDADSIIVAYESDYMDAGFEEGSVSSVSEIYGNSIENNGDEDGEEIINTNDYKLVAVNINDTKTVDTAISEYEQMEGVAYAQPNYIYYYEEDSSSVDDTDRNKQWYLDSVNIPAAWDAVQARPHNKIKVCVLDTGCALNHYDIAINKSLSKEVVGNSLISLSGDGYYNGSKTANISHGTMVTGLIGATVNNSYGIAGVASCYDNSIIDLFVVDVFDSSDSKYASTATIIKGLNYAMENDAKVVNMSLGSFTNENNTAFEDACNMLNDNGIVVVASAGNENTDSFHCPSDFDSVIAVMSTDKNNNKSSFSAYGTDKDICAPGEDIWSTYVNESNISDCKYSSGTSFSAPIVTGIIAMMFSVNPNLSTEQVKSVLYSTATDFGISGKDDIYGYGLVNAENAVKNATVKATGVYPIYQEASVVLGCIHEGGQTDTKYRWEYCNTSETSSSWNLISD